MLYEVITDFPEIFVNLGNALDALDRSEEALQAYDEALARLPETPDAQFNKGYVLNRLGRFNEAIRCFESVLRDHPRDMPSLNGINIAENEF